MARRSKRESMMCRHDGCDKPHEFLQYAGKYYCLECFDELTQHTSDDSLLGAIEELKQT